MDFQQIAIFGGLSVAAFLVAKLGVKLDNRVEDRRRHAVKLASWCEANGLPLIASGLQAYSISDYSGALYALQSAIDVIGDAEASKAALDRFLRVQLDRRLANTDDKAALLDYVQKRLGVVLTATPAEQPKNAGG